MHFPDPFFDTALTQALIGCGLVAFTCWLLGVLTREHSWVDRIWSIIPAVYVAFFAYRSDFKDPRILMMLALVTLWAARLTFNFARKGGYAKGGEDYRWAALRALMPAWAYQVFHIFFIAAYQNLLLLLITLPAWVALRSGPTPLGPLDFVGAGAFLLLLVGEFIADQQQWNFQQAKKAGATLPEPFCTTGLFRYSRHPNFFCEFMQWWALFAIGSNAAGTFANVGLVGATLLTLLFFGSTAFTERLSLQKYPSYANYQKRTSSLIPWFASKDTSSPVVASAK